MCGSEIIVVRTALSAVENYPIYFGMTGGRKLSAIHLERPVVENYSISLEDMF